MKNRFLVSATISSSVAMAATVVSTLCHSPASAQSTPSAPAAAPAADDDLFQSFGGRAGLTALTDDFVERLTVDKRTAPFFESVDKAHLKSQLTDQLCELSGGPCHLVGPSMKKVHASLDIGKRDFNALVEVLQDAMDAKGIPFSVQNRMLAKLAPLNREIISR